MKKLLTSLYLFSLLMHMQSQPIFTGHVATDFNNCNCTLNISQSDFIGDLANVCTGGGETGFAPTGFDIQHMYVHYSPTEDILYIGLDMLGVGGDGDNDGNPLTSTNCLGVDGGGTGSFNSQQALGINIDTDENGDWDYYIGWPFSDLPFGLYSYNLPHSDNFVPTAASLTLVNTVTVNVFAEPDASRPDPEFSISNYSAIDLNLSAAFKTFTDTGPTGGEDSNEIPITSLPVELLTLSAIQKSGGIDLSWETASELNNYGFEIELANHQLKFSKVGFLSGNGTTEVNQKYSYYLNEAYTGTNYIRLKQLDFNGAFSFSPIIEVQVDQSVSFSLQEDYMLINDFNLTSSYRMINIEGKVLKEGKINPSTKRIYIGDLAIGLYFFQINTSRGLISKKFVK